MLITAAKLERIIAEIQALEELGLCGFCYVQDQRDARELDSGDAGVEESRVWGGGASDAA